MAPSADALPPAASYIQQLGLMNFTVGDQWILDVTLDSAAQHITKDLRPTLPMIVHY